MQESYTFPDDGLSSLHTIFMLIIIGSECIVGILANGFIVAIHAAEWIQNKAVFTSGRILLFLSGSRLTLQIFMMLEITCSSMLPHFYNAGVVYNTFKVSFMFLNYCSLWFAAWLSFFYFVKIADFTYPLFLKLKWKISAWMPRILWLSVVVSLCYSVSFGNDIYHVCYNDSFPIPSTNSTKENYITRTNVTSLVLLFTTGLFLPITLFILAASLMIISLKRHTLHMESRATGSRDPSMEAHLGAIKATTYFLILYVFNAVALLLHMSNIFDVNSFWGILCKIVMAAYPASHSVLLILDNPGLRRAWKRFQHHVNLYLK